MTGKPADFVLSVNEISYTSTPLILHVNTHETVEGRKTELREGHNPKRYKFFPAKAECGIKKIMKIWPNEPLPFHRNEEGSSVYKVLLQ